MDLSNVCFKFTRRRGVIAAQMPYRIAYTTSLCDSRTCFNCACAGFGPNGWKKVGEIGMEKLMKLKSV